MSVAALEPSIRKILCAPGTDLNTISAKRVRKQLLELEPGIAEEWVRNNKDQIDALIASVYEGISSATAAQADVSSDSGAPKRKREDDADEPYDGDGDNNDDRYDEEGGPSSPPPKLKKSKSKRGLTDEELARQLSSQLNGSSRSSRSGANGKPKSKKAVSKSAKKTKKSAERVAESDDDNSEDNSDGGKKRRKRKSSGGGGGAKGGFQKEFVLSEPLAALVERDRLSRPQVVKQLWAYIKENDLQNPSNKREIMCDDLLRAVFGVDKIDMFKMNKVLGQHLHEEE